MTIKKHTSADVNPATQFGYLTLRFLTRGLTTGTTSGKAFFNTSDKPKFIAALMATILRNPSLVRCSFF